MPKHRPLISRKKVLFSLILASGLYLGVAPLTIANAAESPAVVGAFPAPPMGNGPIKQPSVWKLGFGVITHSGIPI